MDSGDGSAPGTGAPDTGDGMIPGTGRGDILSHQFHPPITSMAKEMLPSAPAVRLEAGLQYQAAAPPSAKGAEHPDRPCP